MATYTTAALVRKRAENLDATLTDANIEAYIDTAEGMLNSIVGASFVATFVVAKHGVLRMASEAYATACAIGFNPAGFTSLSEASAIQELLAFQWEESLKLLRDKSVIAYMESLL